MLFACWSVKGGSGATVVSATLALTLARHRSDGVLLVDLAGDLPAALGVAEPAGPGVVDWLAAGPATLADSLARLEIEVTPGVHLLPRGSGPWPEGPDAAPLLALLADDQRLAVIDCGTLPLDAPPDVPLLAASAATHSLLVVRPCYLALRRALAAPVRPSRLVVINEPGRALDGRDVESILGVPVLAEVMCDPAVARAVDAGLLTSRLPRALERAMRSAA